MFSLGNSDWCGMVVSLWGVGLRCECEFRLVMKVGLFV
jgi:hypothetical protein